MGDRRAGRGDAALRAAEAQARIGWARTGRCRCRSGRRTRGRVAPRVEQYRRRERRHRPLRPARSALAPHRVRPPRAPAGARRRRERPVPPPAGRCAGRASGIRHRAAARRYHAAARAAARHRRVRELHLPPDALRARAAPVGSSQRPLAAGGGLARARSWRRDVDRFRQPRGVRGGAVDQPSLRHRVRRRDDAYPRAERPGRVVPHGLARARRQAGLPASGSVRRPRRPRRQGSR